MVTFLPSFAFCRTYVASKGSLRAGCFLCRIRVKLDKKDGDGRSVRMDCDCAMIECLYDFLRAGVHALGFFLVCIKSVLGMHCVCTKCAMSVDINRSLLLQCTGESHSGGRRLA